MFIWRDDPVGNRVGEAVLRAAERGVKVSIAKDRLGAIFELGEENRQSFLHKKHDPMTALKQRVINAFSSNPQPFSSTQQRPNLLVESLRTHARVEIDDDCIRNDHSKFIIIDSRRLFFGGMNFEERSVSRDVTGSRWYDYQFYCESSALVDEFQRCLSGHAAQPSQFEFLCNRRVPTPSFAVGPRLLAEINGARDNCRIEMAYFGDAAISIAIVAAALRGVRVQIIVSRHANIQNAKNLRVLSHMFRQSAGRIEIYLLPAMLHAKMIDIDGRSIIVGSTNFNERSIRQFAELNVHIRGDLPCTQTLRRSFEKRRRMSWHVTSVETLAYNRIKASCERVFG